MPHRGESVSLRYKNKPLYPDNASYHRRLNIEVDNWQILRDRLRPFGRSFAVETRRSDGGTRNPSAVAFVPFALVSCAYVPLWNAAAWAGSEWKAARNKCALMKRNIHVTRKHIISVGNIFTRMEQHGWLQRYHPPPSRFPLPPPSLSRYNSVSYVRARYTKYKQHTTERRRIKLL